MYVLNAEEFHRAAEEYPAVKAKLEAWADRSDIFAVLNALSWPGLF